MNIAIITGGRGSEREVSLSSANNIQKSSEIRVEAPFYDTGRKVIYFNTSEYKRLGK